MVIFFTTIISALLMTASSSTVFQLEAPTFITQKQWQLAKQAEQALADQELAGQIRELTLKLTKHEKVSANPKLRLRLEILLGNSGQAEHTLTAIEREEPTQPFHYLHFRLFIEAEKHRRAGMNEATAFEKAFQQCFRNLSDRDAVAAGYYSGYQMDLAYGYLKGAFDGIAKSQTFEEGDALYLLRTYADALINQRVLLHTIPLLEREYRRRFQIEDAIMIQTPDGTQLSAIKVTPKAGKTPLPAAMVFNIYVDHMGNLREAALAACHDYAGIVADARGKRLSPDKPQPYETEVEDVNTVIDWVARQPWCNGSVGMYGGSYLGFAQWAATKRLHPALKTIVPYAAAIPGQGLPMENNVFLNANYGWAAYVTNNKGVDNSVYADPQRWQRLNERYFKEGSAYRELDKLDGVPNPLLQRWLQHPSYDAYWQAMVPYGDDYRRIDIPVLTITGYYDDGQISALHYLDQHVQHRPDAQHYLVIGPYDHHTTQGTQAPMLRGYRLDPSAHIDVKALTFRWLDHVLKGAEKPALVKRRINLQVMGGDHWRHLDHWSDLKKKRRRFYLSQAKSNALPGERIHQLRDKPDEKTAFLKQTVDLANREEENHQYYPWPIVKEKLSIPNGFAFISEPLTKDLVVQGRFSGEMQVRINKKDFDLGLVFYELTAEGEFFHLSYYLGRASYARDVSRRNLLEPNKLTSIPFERTRMTGKLIKKGSRLLVLVNVNKNRHAQINYGTGKDVSDETIADAGEPLEIDWYTNSYIEVSMTDPEPQSSSDNKP